MAYKKPDEMTWDEHVAELYNQITERPNFSYDPNKDPLWQSAKDQYIQGGKRAMEDTMGQAASLTGGYANSYAQSAGQQQYNDYMTKLSGQLGEYASMARQNYDADTAALKDQLAYAQGMAEQEYNRGRDALADQRYQQEWDAEQAYREWQKQQQEQNTAWEHQRSEADAASDRDYRAWQMRQSEQNNAYSWAMQMLQSGKMPSDATLAAAGIDPTEAKQYANYYAGMIAQSNSGGSRSGSRQSSGGSSYRGTPSSTSSTSSTTPTTKQSGAAYNKIKSAMMMALQTGNRTYAEQGLDQYYDSLSSAEKKEILDLLDQVDASIEKRKSKYKVAKTTNSTKNTGGGRKAVDAIM